MPFYTVDSLGIVIATYPTQRAADCELWKDRAEQARRGLSRGELDYRTVDVRHDLGECQHGGCTHCRP